MAKEILAVPEGSLLEVIKVIRTGLKSLKNDRAISKETREQLTKWCDEEEAYIKPKRPRRDSNPQPDG